MKINFKTLMAWTNENYAYLKGNPDATIRSDQVKALAQAVAEVLEIMQNQQIDRNPQIG